MAGNIKVKIDSMVFVIGFGDCYPEQELFDIEYYQNKVIHDLWQSEIKVLPCIGGITKFLESVKDKDFDYDQFIKDGKKIQELRGWLFEKDGNRPKSLKENDIPHYGHRLKYIRKVITDFANKYGLYISED